MGDGRHRVEYYEMINTRGVIHGVGVASLGLACGGRIASSQAEPAYPPAVISCLWCLTGTRDPWLRWFKWADEL